MINTEITYELLFFGTSILFLIAYIFIFYIFYNFKSLTIRHLYEKVKVGSWIIPSFYFFFTRPLFINTVINNIYMGYFCKHLVRILYNYEMQPTTVKVFIQSKITKHEII